MGVLPVSRQQVCAPGDAYRESTESWDSVVRDLKRRGMGARILVVGGADPGMRAALRKVSLGGAGTTLLVTHDRKGTRQAAQTATRPGQRTAP
jgi:transposase-like protein